MESPAPIRASTGIQRTREPCAGLIGPTYWRNNTLKELKNSEDIICKSDKSVLVGRSIDPVQGVRDVLAVLSNDEAHRYTRQVRLMVHRLREKMIEVNNEMCMMNRCREAIEKEHEHINKDLVVNLDSQRIREQRPMREKCKDGVDDLLNAERMHLLNLKKMLEVHLRMILDQLQMLDQVRQRLQCVIRERTCVLELVCNSIPSVGAQNMYIKKYNVGPGRRCKSACAGPVNDDCPSGSDIFFTDSLQAQTPEVQKAIEDALMAMLRSPQLRRECYDMIRKSQTVQKSAHEAVQQGLSQKLAETNNLKTHLTIAAGETKYATNRVQRLYDRTEHAWWNTRGPEASRDLMTRERLDRPTVKVLQRHPGHNMPEAQELVRNDHELLDSLHTTGRNIGLLRMAQNQLDNDISDKINGMYVDNSVVKMRGSKARHRWVLQTKPDILKSIPKP